MTKKRSSGVGQPPTQSPVSAPLYVYYYRASGLSHDYTWVEKEGEVFAVDQQYAEGWIEWLMQCQFEVENLSTLSITANYQLGTYQSDDPDCGIWFDDGPIPSELQEDQTPDRKPYKVGKPNKPPKEPTSKRSETSLEQYTRWLAENGRPLADNDTEPKKTRSNDIDIDSTAITTVVMSKPVREDEFTRKVNS